MKLAEALMERAELRRRLQDLRERILRNAKHQEGDAPTEDPKDLLTVYNDVSTAFERLVVRINLANNRVTLADGRLMVKALALRDSLKEKHSLFKSLVAEATPKQDRYSKKEIRFISAVSVKEMQHAADLLAKEYRELDGLIQQANWNNSLDE